VTFSLSIDSFEKIFMGLSSREIKHM